MIKVLIADDHTIVRAGLKQILDCTSDIRVIDEAINGKEVLSKVAKKKFDILVLDITMPGRDGLDILKELKSIQPELQVLILTMHPEGQFALRAMKAGASGYLMKISAPEELIKAIRKVALGEKYITSSLAQRLADSVVGDLKEPSHSVLSDREYKVFCLIASGQMLKEIASELSLSISTITTYRKRLLHKMNMKTDAEIIRYAIKEGLVD